MTEQESSEQLAARFDDRAATYDESTMHRELAAMVAGFIVTSGLADVLDAATGTGLVLRALRPRLDAGVRLIGVDLSPGMLSVAATLVPEATFLVHDATRLPFDDDSFDLVTCVTSIHLMPDAGAALREWSRVLRPQGHIVVATFATEVNWGHLVSLPEAAQDAGLAVTRLVNWPEHADPELPDLVIAELAAASG